MLTAVTQLVWHGKTAGPPTSLADTSGVCARLRNSDRSIPSCGFIQAQPHWTVNSSHVLDPGQTSWPRGAVYRLEEEGERRRDPEGQHWYRCTFRHTAWRFRVNFGKKQTQDSDVMISEAAAVDSGSSQGDIGESSFQDGGARSSPFRAGLLPRNGAWVTSRHLDA